MPWRRLVCLVLMLASGTCGAVEFRNEIRGVLEGATEVELLSIDPSLPRKFARDPGYFNGWSVLGRMAVKGEESRKLISSLKESLWQPGGQSPACFNPRHAIRAQLGGRTVDLVICFECVKTRLFLDGIEDREWIPHGREPEPSFNAALKAAGVPLAPSAEEQMMEAIRRAREPQK